MGDSELLQCYNRGCGQKFNAKDNKEDSCRHHPGEPVFHDAYKGWSCCNKKCTDFTEFLNIKGCTLSAHSNVKPPEPEKPKSKEIDDAEIIVVKPIVPNALPRPPITTPLTVLKPELAPSLKQQVLSKPTSVDQPETDEVSVGTPCKNSGCRVHYQGPQTNESTCIYHSGVPIFHEGLKYWTCCNKKTTDFQTFLDQPGCSTGNHLWKSVNTGDKKQANCRWDYHQTASHVIVAIYAKQYDVSESVVKLNPIRLNATLVFPQDSSTFPLDVELKGIVDVEKSKVTMYSTKVEISLKKAEPGSWSKLGTQMIVQQEDKSPKKDLTAEQQITSGVDAVDLSNL